VQERYYRDVEKIFIPSETGIFTIQIAKVIKSS